MKTLRPFLQPYRRALFWGPTFKLTEALFELILPLVMAQLIDLGVKGGSIEALRLNLWLMLGLVVGGLIFSFACQYMASVASQGFGTQLREALFEKTLRLTPTALQRFGTASLTNRANVDVNQLQLAVAMAIRLLSRAPFLCVFGVVMAWRISRLGGMILLFALIPATLVIYFIYDKSLPYFQKARRALDKVSRLILDLVTGVQVIRAFNRQDHEEAYFQKANDDLSEKMTRALKISALMNPFTTVILNLAAFATLRLGGFEVVGGNLTEGELLALINYGTQVLMALTVAANVLSLLSRTKNSVDRLEEVLVCDEVEDKSLAGIEAGAPVAGTTATSPSVANEAPVASTTETATAAAAAFRTQVRAHSDFLREVESLGPDDTILEVRDLSFSYEGQPYPTLDALNFELKAGQTLGILGPTGAGKTTLLRLLLKHHEPSQGQIFLAGRESREIPVSEWREAYAIAPQKPTLFTGTIRSNLIWGLAAELPWLTDEEIDERLWQALELAQGADFVRALPDGLGAPVQRDGRNFSGGQRQRLSLARALLKQAPILIQDDSSSALDFKTDALIRQGLAHDRPGLTRILVSQRVHTLLHAEHILLLEDGKLTAQGTHEELLERSPMYREICAYQLKEVEHGRS